MKLHLQFVFSLSCFFVQVAVCGVLTVVANAPQMNILVLYADDWRHDTLGAAGNPVVQTPVLDQLASQGMRFTENCVTTSICGISRATLFTGQWMSRHGNEAFGSFKTPWSETYPGLLSENGYYVGHVGKWHNGKFPAEHFDFGRSYAGKHWTQMPDGSKVHVTKRNEKDALEFLRTRPSEKPFCLTVAFFATHAEDDNPLQFLPQPQSMDLYKDVTVPVPPNATAGSFHRLPEFIANKKNEGRNRWHWRFDTPEKFQTMMKNYYRLATEVDSTCGLILEELKNQGVSDNTLVIFTTDNGYYHAEHGLADKWYPHQESIRVPLIVRDPRMPKINRGKTNNQFTLSVDLAPTILSAAGIPAPKSMQGRDISPLYVDADPADTKSPWRNEFFYEHPTIRNISFIPSSQALVRKDWKYIYWPDFDREQLFDLISDPQEEHDLVAAPEHAELLAEMRARFAELRAKAR
ncbi:sulfatase family protein [Bythopirellula polymerisocia]|uniref:Arylsulfatase n=1 Tax=Bythopirellula polymerisocia TaxID=2528003 RepID=A0A5C6D189_9BACT|nr:sulfatase [Bythopirellula polymerisocia]TWU28659.1 Arylsulfatase [Bythopirellula polymerisocia]